MANIGRLFRRFAGPVIAAYLLYLGVWTVLFVATEIAMFVMTRTVNWFAMVMFGQFSVVEQEAVAGRYLAEECTEAAIPIILGLLVGWWLMRRRRRSLEQTVPPHHT
jgi:uncharacterized protein (TIGR03382 family)